MRFWGNLRVFEGAGVPGWDGFSAEKTVLGRSGFPDDLRGNGVWKLIPGQRVKYVAEDLNQDVMSAPGTLETVNQFLNTKYPTLLTTVALIVFAWFATTRFNSIEDRLKRVETTELPEIRLDIKELRTGVSQLNGRVTTVEVKVDNLSEDMEEVKDDLKEIKADIKTLLMRKP